MFDFLRNGLIFLVLIVFFPFNVDAKRGWDADAVITVRDGTPCFSYPQDKEIKKRPYSFSSLYVSNLYSDNKIWWGIEKVNSKGKNILIEPNSPDNCIRYGVQPPGTVIKKPAKSFLMNTPYAIHIWVSTPSEGPLYERSYRSRFCLVHDEKGNTVVVDVRLENREFKCVEPSEKPKGTLWERLFGK